MRKGCELPLKSGSFGDSVKKGGSSIANLIGSGLRSCSCTVSEVTKAKNPALNSHISKNDRDTLRNEPSGKYLRRLIQNYYNVLNNSNIWNYHYVCVQFTEKKAPTHDFTHK